MNERKPKRGFRPLADMTSGLMDPMLQKRAGISLSLLQSWEDIVGPAIGSSSRPLRIVWPRRLHQDEPFNPATLIIACEGFAALQIQHETGEIISRVNGFLGFSAIGRIKIEQKPPAIDFRRKPKRLAPLAPSEERRIDKVTDGIEDDALRAALARLGKNILAEKRATKK
ncbi:DUF721 domain-containing protein [Brucella pseudogrignonensis]|uniref:DUF721 domain-containing protein n=1 Tax=Brucella pseudogrignonensis TaxID=419475 RepID=UPI0028B9185D|nr:DUF721 domain-containing protein [Brucella pseudogrignonensis]MDT6940330.1 DUF721 domain-containing protein [Brucella pseudogrignonensis]